MAPTSPNTAHNALITELDTSAVDVTGEFMKMPFNL